MLPFCLTLGLCRREDRDAPPYVLPVARNVQSWFFADYEDSSLLFLSRRALANLSYWVKEVLTPQRAAMLIEEYGKPPEEE